MRVEEIGDDLVLANAFGVEQFDLLVLGVGGGCWFAVGLEGGSTVLEEDLESVAEGVDVDLVPVAQIGDRHPSNCEKWYAAAFCEATATKNHTRLIRLIAKLL